MIDARTMDRGTSKVTLFGRAGEGAAEAHFRFCRADIRFGKSESKSKSNLRAGKRTRCAPAAAWRRLLAS
jgi:hypothetical protein